LIYLFIDYVG